MRNTLRFAVCNATAVFALGILAACSGGGGGPGAAQVAPPTASGGGPSFTVGSSPATFSEFPIAPGEAGPSAIAVALDGNAWFMSNTAVNRITGGGTVTPFTDPNFSQFDQAYSDGTDIILGPDGALWFTAVCAVGAPGTCRPLEMYLGRITTAGSITLPGTVAVSDTTHSFFQSALVSGTQGNIWTEGVEGSVNTRTGYYQDVTLGGTVLFQKTLPLACPNIDAFHGFFPAGMTRGADGAIYIAANGLGPNIPNCGAPGAAVFRIDASGTITNTFAVPTAGIASLSSITSGPDGNLWIAASKSTIVRMTLSGQTTVYTTPTPNTGISQIAAGNDGAMWFTEFDASKIGRITTAGVITEYPTTTANAGPTGIASLPGECGPGHGRIWFTEFNANKVGRIDF